MIFFTQLRRAAVGALFFTTLLPPLTADAHKLNIFAWPSGTVIYGEVIFSGGRKAKNVNVTVQNAADHTMILETNCDEQGEFHFVLPKQVAKELPDLLLVANAGEGHRGEWLLPVTDYSPAAGTLHPPATTTAQPAVATGSAAITEPMLRRIIAEELNNELSPIRKAIAESNERKPDLQDILGGIGWIVGIAGLFAWIKNRRKEEKSKCDK